jgi:hypothetical protein
MRLDGRWNRGRTLSLYFFNLAPDCFYYSKIAHCRWLGADIWGPQSATTAHTTLYGEPVT